MQIDLAPHEIAAEILRRTLYPEDQKIVDSITATTENLPLVRCPFHNEKTGSFSINVKKQLYNCFGCSEHGTLNNLYYQKFGHSIYKDLGITRPGAPLRTWGTGSTEKLSYDQVPDVSFHVSGGSIPINESPAASAYVKRRGFTDYVINDMKMRVATDMVTESDGKKIYFSNRLIIPVYEKGKLLTIEGRDIYGKDAWLIKHPDIDYRKCIYPKGSSSNTVYQWEKLDKSKPLYFTEGLMDVATMRTCSRMRNSTSVFGAAITERQLYILSKFSSLTYVVNNDRAGWTSLLKMRKTFKKPFDVLVPPRGAKDINEIITKLHETVDNMVNRQWLSYARPVSDYDIEKIIEGFPPK